MIVAIAYRVGIVYIKFIGTHAQYDAVDAATVDMN
jgi:mRNA interferase HigB